VWVVSEVVTGEAVVLSVRVAALPTRALAVIVDLAVQGIALLGATLLLIGTRSVVDDALGTALYVLVIALVLVGYPVVFETVTRGRSLGKMTVGLRVVADDGGPERFRQAFFRGLAGVIEIWATSGAVALFASLASERGKRLGDVFAGTIVIGERAPREAPPPPMPPGLETWARSLELSGLSDELATSARRYLTRWAELAPEVQHAMGARIAANVASCVTPPPPPNLPPYPYLAAVLAERRRRTEAWLAARVPAPPTVTPQTGPPPGSAQPPPGSAQPPPARPTRDGFVPPG
jgi:uncharacterized RDD family membrane protein YckC